MNSSLRACLTRLALVAISLIVFAATGLSTVYYVNASSGEETSLCRCRLDPREYRQAQHVELA